MKCDFGLILIFFFELLQLLLSFGLMLEVRVVESVWSLGLPDLDLFGFFLYF